MNTTDGILVGLILGVGLIWLPLLILLDRQNPKSTERDRADAIVLVCIAVLVIFLILVSRVLGI